MIELYIESIQHDETKLTKALTHWQANPGITVAQLKEHVENA